MAEVTPHYPSTPPISFGTTAAVTGGQLVSVTGNMTVGPAGAASTAVVGVAARDAGGTNQQNQVPVYRDGIHDLTATGAIAAGDKVAAAAAGTVAPIGANVFTTKVGTALEAIANGAKGRIALELG